MLVEQVFAIIEVNGFAVAAPGKSPRSPPLLPRAILFEPCFSWFLLRCPHCVNPGWIPPTRPDNFASICSTCKGRGGLTRSVVARRLMITPRTLNRLIAMGKTRQDTAIDILARLTELRWL
jgi:hypothetical protein